MTHQASARRRSARRSVRRTLKRIAQASAGGGAAVSPLLAVGILGHSTSAATFFAVAAVIVAVTVIRSIGPKLATLLWLTTYTRLLTALIRKGIAHTENMADIHSLITDLREARSGIGPADSE